MIHMEVALRRIRYGATLRLRNSIINRWAGDITPLHNAGTIELGDLLIAIEQVARYGSIHRLGDAPAERIVVVGDACRCTTRNGS